MCPEKERLMRECKHQLAVFELEEGSRTVMNHLIAVKQYSRSSADQELPLPHELRPEPVLKLTMTYLMQNIMDLCDVSETNISDWFHFLWDRTRSIRKDITQQELCSLDAVQLVEQCARFHIHCAARLIAEGPQVFDQKINTENLTKCLQTLKYMYHDLNLKLIRCPKEAEFRGYVILLNLHDTNFLWEVKQLRPEIRNSPEVKFAIKVYLAMESRNYVQFFALVRSTTYMNACILLRYFTQMRVKALNIILKAYIARAPISMSISNLTYILAFEDFEQCAQFLEYYGLACDRDDDRVFVDRSTFYYPDMPFILERAINVVEHKRMSSVGEAVHGDVLDTKDVLEKYEPHDSFDENGYLLSKAWSAEDQNYFRPEARIEARNKANRRSPLISDEDEIVFKKPTSLPPLSPRTSSPKLKPSTKSVSKNLSSTFLAAADEIDAQKNVFATANSGSSSQATKENNIFGGFGHGSATASSSSSLFSSQKPLPTSQLAAPKSLFSFAQTPQSNSNFSFKLDSTSEATKNENRVDFSAAAVSNDIPNNSRSNLFGQKAYSVEESNESQRKSLFGNFTTESAKFSPVTQSTSFSSFQSANSYCNLQMPAFSSNLGDAFSAPMKTKRESEEMQREEERKRQLEIELKLKAEEGEAERKRAQQKAEAERREKKKREMIEASEELRDAIIDEITASELKKLAEGEVQRYRNIQQRIQDICNDLVREVVENNAIRIATQVRAAFDKNILMKYFARWQSVTRQAIEQRKKIENTPVWIPNRALSEMVPELSHPLQSYTLSTMKRYRSGIPTQVSLPQVKKIEINVWSHVVPPLLRITDDCVKSNIYWKCIISLPDREEDELCGIISQWLEQNIKRHRPKSEEIFFAEQKVINKSTDQRLSICLRLFAGANILTETKRTAAKKEDFDGSNAAIFFVSMKNLHFARMRLQSLRQKTNSRLPLSVCVYNSNGEDSAVVANILNLEDQDCIFQAHDHVSFAAQIGNCLEYVATNSPVDDKLEMQPLTSLLSECLADEFWNRLTLSIASNPTLSSATTKFSFLCHYHNAAIDRMVSICTPNVEETHEFPPELRPFVPLKSSNVPANLPYFPANWKEISGKSRISLRKLFNALRIHDDLSFKNVTEIQSLEHLIIDFVQKYIHSRSEAEKTAYKMLQKILDHVGSGRIDPIELRQSLARFNWTECFGTFAISLLTYQYKTVLARSELSQFVIYDRAQYLEYKKTNWWLSLNLTELKMLTTTVIRDTDVEIDRLEQSRKRQRIDVTALIEQEQNEVEAALAKGYASLSRADDIIHKLHDNYTISREISHDLDHSLYRHKQTMNEMKYLLRTSEEE